MKPKPRDAYHHHDLRTALIDAAAEMIEVDGMGKLSVRAIAQQLDVSHPAVYRHFANKEALLVQVAIRGLRRLEGTLKRVAREGGDAKAVIRRCSMAYVRFGLRHAALYDLMFSPMVQRDPESRAVADQLLAGVAHIITSAQAPVDSAQLDPLDLARSAWALVHGVVDLFCRGQLGETTHRRILLRADALLHAMLYGMTPTA